MFDAKPGLFIKSKDVLWLKYLFFTSFRLSVYSLQRVDIIVLGKGVKKLLRIMIIV